MLPAGQKVRIDGERGHHTGYFAQPDGKGI